jgi:F0F1-type ATP synthase membrane subunit b/b'
VSEFDQLKKDAEREVQEHPQQVHEAEQDAEKEGKEFLDKESGGERQDDATGGDGQQGQHQGGQPQ